MIDMRERKYIKFRVDMCEDTKFKIIDRMPKRDLIYYVWNRFVLLAGKVNKEGDLYMSKNIPYTIETLAIEFNRDIDEIKTALDVLIELEMIEFIEGKVYRVKNFAKHQNIKVKEKLEIRKKENEINNTESTKIEEDVAKIDNEIEVRLGNRIALVSTEEKEDSEDKSDKNEGISFSKITEINLDMENNCNNESVCDYGNKNMSENRGNNENKSDNRGNVNQKENEKNYISQHNNSPVILQMKEKQNANKNNKKTRKKKIRDNIIEISDDNEFINISGEENEEELSCWGICEDMKPKDGDRVILEMSF